MILNPTYYTYYLTLLEIPTRLHVMNNVMTKCTNRWNCCLDISISSTIAFVKIMSLVIIYNSRYRTFEKGYLSNIRNILVTHSQPDSFVTT